MLRGHLVERAEALLGTAVVATTPIAGGEASTATRLRLSNGTSALVKTHPRAPAGFFAAEARGLRMLREAGAPAVEVLAQADDAIVVRWHEPVRPTAELAAGFGRALAALHTSRGADAERFGGEQDGFIAALPLPNRGAETWPEFYATRRVLPYLKLARDRGHVTPAQGAMVEDVVRRITDLAGPTEQPSLIHGDLWSGNVVWAADEVVLIDPAAHAGHRETDLAMLALFGLPELDRVMAAYREVAPLADGWEERQPLHQLHPLLVHAALFGGSYGEQAARAADRLLHGSRDS